MRKDREEFKKTLKVLQGEMPPKKAMPSIVIKQFEELRMELEKVKNYKYSQVEETKQLILQYQMRYGLYLEKINTSDIETWDKLYQSLRKALLAIKEAQIMQENERLATQKEELVSEEVEGLTN